MTACLWLVTGLVCAQFGEAGSPPLRPPTPTIAQRFTANAPQPQPAASRIVAVTVYQGQALVSREVAVPEGEGVVELVVTPLPAETVNNSLHAEGSDGIRVLSNQFQTRTVKDDTRREAQTQEEALKKLGLEAQRLQSEISARQKDLQYLSKLEGFTATTLNSLSEKGRFDDAAVLTLSRFVMDSRGEKSKAEVDLRQALQANSEAVEAARWQLGELAAGSSRVERDALIVVQKTRREAGTVRLGYLVGASSWWPQYRLRGAINDAPVRLEYLAAVVQESGEDWPAVRVTLSTARPSLDAAPPELLPLKINIADVKDSGPTDTLDDQSQRIAAELAKPVEMSFKAETPLEEVIRYVRQSTSGSAFPSGIPIYVDPQGLQEADKTMASPVSIDLHGIPLRKTLHLLLRQLGLEYEVEDGLLTITSMTSHDNPAEIPDSRRGMVAGMGGGLEGTGLSMELAQASGVAMLNRAAAGDQAEEMRVGKEAVAEFPLGEKDGPSVSFAVEGALGIVSRPDPQLLEIGRVELPAEYYAKAVPVLTPRVYRLAKLTNQSDFVLLPGEGSVYVGTEFVGRMKLPLVASGEPFVVGFGVDPQLQVSRRLIRKGRTIQGGNQVFSYEFRINLRNYRSGPVKVQLWDRLPNPEGEAVVVNLTKTSADLSSDALYAKTGRADNLLRWDLEVPQGTIGDKTLTVNYEFRLEYARDLPQPRFLSGGLGEGPIGGGAMGGAMGGFQ